MSLVAHIFTFGICLAVGHSSTIDEHKTGTLNEVLKDLPTEMCDFIVVSPLPFLGEISLHNCYKISIL